MTLGTLDKNMESLRDIPCESSMLTCWVEEGHNTDRRDFCAFHVSSAHVSSNQQAANMLSHKKNRCITVVLKCDFSHAFEDTALFCQNIHIFHT